MLRQAPCHWLHCATGSFLDWHQGCIAYVKPDGVVTIQSWGVSKSTPAASRAQGVRFVERWVSARKGLPARSRKLRPSLPPIDLARGRLQLVEGHAFNEEAMGQRLF